MPGAGAGLHFRKRQKTKAEHAPSLPMQPNNADKRARRFPATQNPKGRTNTKFSNTILPLLHPR